MKRIKKETFILCFNGVLETLPLLKQSKFRQRDFYLALLIKDSNLDYFEVDKAYQRFSQIKEEVERSVLMRVIAVCELLDENNKESKIDLKRIWGLIYDSLAVFDDEEILGTIGSQGFLSIPLMHSDNADFNFLRLHIWHDSLRHYIDQEKTNLFAIHCHKFYAQSWIISGEIFNTRYNVLECDSVSDFSFFEIKWNSSTAEINRNNSVAVNTGLNAIVTEISKEYYLPGDNYEIDSGKYHKSRVNLAKSINSTIFLFSSRKNRIPKSFVIGPSEIKASEINRTVKIKAKELINELNESIVGYGA